jgi:hypothetical protein
MAAYFSIFPIRWNKKDESEYVDLYAYITGAWIWPK